MIKKICPECEQQTKNGTRLKKLRGTLMCTQCYKKIRDKRRSENLAILKKEGIIGLNPQEKHEKCLKEGYKSEIKNLQIKGAKKGVRGKLVRISAKGLYLTLDEKRLLFRKYVKEGYSYEEADELVKERSRDMQELTMKLREQKKSEKEIETTFKEEFNQLLIQ